MNVRDAEAGELADLARIWYDGWYDAHAQIVPAELAAFRTLESFRERLRAALPNVRVAGPAGAAAGFYIVKDDELYQLFVSAQSRGSGVAAALIADAEARLHDAGFGTAWLACAVGNERAARFYEKAGWHRAGTREYSAETSSGEFILQVWRYENPLGFGDDGLPANGGRCSTMGSVRNRRRSPAAPHGDAMTETRDIRAVVDAAEQAAATGDYASAEQLLTEVAVLQGASLGPLHPDLANTLNNLGVVCEILEKPQRAERHFRRAYRSRRRRWSPIIRLSRRAGRTSRISATREEYRSTRHLPSLRLQPRSKCRRRCA